MKGLESLQCYSTMELEIWFGGRRKKFENWGIVWKSWREVTCTHGELEEVEVG